MNKINIKNRTRCLFLIIFVCGFHFADAQNATKQERKAAIEFAKSIDFINLNPVTATATEENGEEAEEKQSIYKGVTPAFILPNVGIDLVKINVKIIRKLNLDKGVFGGSGFIVNSGHAVLEVTCTASSYTCARVMTFNFVEGKFYTIDCTTDKNIRVFDFSINEITEQETLEKAKQAVANGRPDGVKKTKEPNPAVGNQTFAQQYERVDEYLAFPKENPAHLEGVWRSTFTPKKPVTITFQDNKITIHREYSIGKPYHVEGVFHFDKQTVKADIEGGFLAPPRKLVWYYELNGGIMNIYDAPIDTYQYSGSINGEYKKVKE